MDIRTIMNNRGTWMIIIVGFVLLVTFFDNDNLFDRWEIKRNIKELEQQRDYYQQRITADSTLLENLKNDQFLEQYARENFMMKREGEILYLIKE